MHLNIRLHAVTVGTLTSVIAQKIRPNPLTTTRLLESIMMARTQGPKTPLLPHSRWSMTMTPTTRSIGATPIRCTPSVLGKRLVSTTVRTPTRPSAGRCFSFSLQFPCHELELGIVILSQNLYMLASLNAIFVCFTTSCLCAHLCTVQCVEKVTIITFVG